MRSFQYYTPTKVVFGEGMEREVGKLVKEFGGKKLLIHYGGGSVIRSGLMDRVTDALKAENISYVMLGGVVPNPRLSLVYQGIELCKEEQVDMILAIGGGSVIDSAKAIGYGVVNDGDIWDYYMGKRKVTGCLPIGVVLTLAATGSEMSSSSVITKEEGLMKRGCGSDFARPKFAVMNPELTKSLPDYQTACGCTDICMHTMERYFTGVETMEITDQIAEALLRTVMENALVLVEHPDDSKARAEVMWAGSLSHNGLTGCGSDGGDWMPHKLEHEVSGLYDVAHGAGLAAIWGSWARYVYQANIPRFKRFAMNVCGINAEAVKAEAVKAEAMKAGAVKAQALIENIGEVKITQKNVAAPEINSEIDEEIALKGIEAMEEFFRKLHMPTNLHELGVHPTQEELKEMAHKCALGVGGAKGSIKVLYEADMLAILTAAL